MQMMVLAIALVFMTVVAMAFFSAVRASGAAVQISDPESERTRLIWAMLALGAVVTMASLLHWPHAVAKGADTVTVNATGYQWYWEFDREEVPAGKPIVFNVHTKDVTHGLGVVSPSGRLLFQTQAMPGYVNKVEHVFDQPGTYRVLCLEFCGTAHHDMTSELNVVSE